MQYRYTLGLLGLAAAAAAAAPAHAAETADGKWFARVAATQLTLADDMEMRMAGTTVPGAGMDTKSHYTATFHVGRFVTKNIALSVTGGIPPHISIQGAGSLAPVGKLAEITYGPATAMVQYHVNRDGPVSAYAGVGACYMIVMGTTDAALQDVRIDNDLGPAAEVGAEFKLSPRYGIFVEAKKALLRTHARGTFGGAPVDSDVKLDPWALSAGVTFHF